MTVASLSEALLSFELTVSRGLLLIYILNKMTSVLDYWSGNPQNEIQHGQITIQEHPSHAQNQYLLCKVVPIHMHIIEFC